MKITLYTGGLVQTNGYLIQTPEGTLLIDAPEGVAAYLSELGVRVDDVLLTHQHYDHVMDAAALQAQGARLHALQEHSTDLTLESAARGWGLPIRVKPYQVDVFLNLDVPLKLAGLEMQLAHIPGHSVDSVTFYLPSHGVLFSGDTLFAGSVGRTDLPGGSTSQLLSGIRKHLLKLPEQTQVFSGHGPATSIGEEILRNPYLQ
jgi:glyoxylase-like metal-dependent hydrolase (beta-lactamase superfamily II)